MRILQYFWFILWTQPKCSPPNVECDFSSVIRDVNDGWNSQRERWHSWGLKFKYSLGMIFLFWQNIWLVHRIRASAAVWWKRIYKLYLTTFWNEWFSTPVMSNLYVSKIAKVTVKKPLFPQIKFAGGLIRICVEGGSKQPISERRATTDAALITANPAICLHLQQNSCSTNEKITYDFL